MEQILKQAFLDAYVVLGDFIKDEKNFQTIGKIAEELAEAYKNGKKSVIAGNGGSNCDAMHFAEEFTGRFRK